MVAPSFLCNLFYSVIDVSRETMSIPIYLSSCSAQALSYHCLINQLNQLTIS